MKKNFSTFFFLVGALFFIVGCAATKTTTIGSADLPASVVDFQSQPAPETDLTVPSQGADDGGLARYRADWFEVRYPKTFSASPTEPNIVYNGETIITTNEAHFTSEDAGVEFYVFSPQWSGEPEYLKVIPGETVVSEKTEESGEGLSKKRVQWFTYQAKDGSYYRSVISIREQVDTGSDLHRVFGFKYRDEAVYEKYKEDFVSFEKSLRQFAD